MQKFCVQSGLKEYKSCRSRKMLKNEYLVTKIGLDTAENEPEKVRKFELSGICNYTLQHFKTVELLFAAQLPLYRLPQRSDILPLACSYLPPFPRIDFSKGENNCYSNRTLQPRTDLPKVCVPTYERLWIPPTLPYRFKETAVAAGCQATCAAARVSVGKA